LVDGSKAIKKGEYGDASADREIEATRKVKEIRNRLKEAETFASEEHLDVDELAMAARQFHGSLEKAAHHVNLDRSKIADLDDVKIAVDQLRAAAKESSKTLAEVNTGGGAGSGAAKVKGARDSARDELVAAIIEERSR
jgi:ribonuclease I